MRPLLCENGPVSNSPVWTSVILEKQLRGAPLPDAVTQSFQREKDHFPNRAQTIDERT